MPCRFSEAETRSERRGPPIAAAILTLVVGAVLVATIILLVVTLAGPPPMNRPTMLGEIAAALRGRPAPPRGDFGGGPPPPKRGASRLFDDEQASIAITRASVAPSASDGRARIAAVETRLAGLLDSSPDRVVAISDQQAPPGFVQRDIRGDYAIGWRTGDGAWRIARPGPRPFLSGWQKATLAATLLAIIALAFPAWIIARAITRPLRQLADAAEDARAGAHRPDFPRGGPAEVRALTGAVAAMHDRLARHAEARTAMIAAIAHDLGTPLSRLSFWIEQLPEAARERAVRDVDEMRAMIGDTLAFARDEAGERDATLVDLGSLLDALVEDMRVGGSAVTVEAGPRAVVRGDPRGLRRAFANLIGNAIRYGDKAAVRWAIEGESAIVSIEDEGPGIDPAQAERLFDPFVRGEASRNRATGGTGLGLAIVRSIAARHGGAATLANRPGGGAIATLRLPLAR